MECYRDQREREEREEKQFQNNIVNAGADVVGLAGSFAGAMNAYSNYKNLKNEYAELQKEFAELQKKAEKERKEKDTKIDNLNKALAQSTREWYQNVLYEIIYPLVEPTIRVAHEQGTSLSIEQLKEVIAILIKQACENTELKQHEIDFIIFLVKKTEIIQYIASYNTCPNLVEFINNSVIITVNNYGINYFHENITPFFSMFTPQEIAAGYPSNETFSWASKEQIKSILWILMPCYGQRIILFDENLQYLDKEQVNKLTSEQIQAIKNAKIHFPQNSPIYQKIYAKTKEIPPTGKSECCLLI